MSTIKQGYKQTKVGIIPEDWEVIKLGSVLNEKPKYGINAPAVEYSDELPTYLRITDIDTNGHFNPDKKASVDDKGYKSFILKENEIVFARTGATVGKSYLYDKNDGELVYAGFLIKVAPNTKKLHSIFLRNFTDTHKYWNWIQLMSARSGQPGVNGEEYSIMPIPLPPLKEQEKIAEILTTWDEAITKQTELLRAKELLKIALMQKLLSGEVRFSGFSDEWEEVRIKDIFEITRGYVLAVTEMSQEQTTEYKYPVYSSQTKNNGLTGYYKDYLFENCITWTTDGANAGDVNLRKGKFYCTNVCGVLKSDKGYANQCIAEILNRITKNYVSYVGNPKLMNNTMGGIKIKIPKSLPEQQKIAEVLSLADDEINLLKNELQELKQQKKALMQKLLTGEVRVKV
ncbi:restriction endonuclease subunit S [Aliarcobacter butzleri]|uniref:restriction endonuclease subunit S n=1 Tax=Aliarcobacter butzleri TaxID=28197 RepID=UPI000DB0768C|nr:restriction endonuclease subunit S [Aliarcobacter butzleri]MCG3688414.1 restriction endonuclease subunit S [Aliarcobacter butzleri]MCT7653020.1 restriction endonuclease subunit S [Aliarcobacter butzleri]PZQ05369.1 MAG: restriction endonuclease subunit S [Aliarcobacter butzleri]